ncbi:alcohol dehydrogenase catalytic domain-containing protein [Psychrosphaera sp. B3R10]|uniref:zinc-dependent alcohol dehydrogenase n=1 Tax=unclassified Psychrosphaera TaxID=2641570 RepID=UPI001C08A318|nr:MULTISPECIES: alcohol dehydrogenase catalytic domain-containing protein [unclassified Psychrosphaera]MBU2880816.1 alcohol dehydrogenase catalytic domain-containing protein [Psychrosphaera sp. I2R16]MBU2990965.1 alcohol dehydrogenase catalytic domain-containing protein [Psychrosphaera sp. B3R10]MDO6720764.1 alcohol dehydrogenase catalytic domain-containing protein [Psychrosphaera sp. 1_MG-2023]
MLAAQYIGNKNFNIVEGQALKPGAGEVRLNVGYVGICGTDMHIYHGVMDQRVNPPATIGHEISGVVAELGDGVTGFSIGDKVVVRPLDWCGECPTCNAGYTHICQNLKFMGIDSPGAFQNSWTVKSRTLHKLPANVDLQQGALIEPLSVACHDIRRSRLQAGEKVVVLGGGPIGQLVAAVAKSVGAEVLVSEPNESRRAFATEKLGVSAVNPIDTDLAKFVDEWTETKGADVVFEVSGVKPAIDAMTQIAGRRGRIVMVAIHAQAPEIDLFQFFWKELELLGARVYEAADFDWAVELISSGKIDVRPFISSVNELKDIGKAFAGMDNNPTGMKALVSCGAE